MATFAKLFQRPKITIVILFEFWYINLEKGLCRFYVANVASWVIKGVLATVLEKPGGTSNTLRAGF